MVVKESRGLRRNPHGIWGLLGGTLIFMLVSVCIVVILVVVDHQLKKSCSSCKNATTATAILCLMAF